MELIFDGEECVVEEVIDDGKHLSCGDEKIQELLDNPDEIGRMHRFRKSWQNSNREQSRQTTRTEQ